MINVVLIDDHTIVRSGFAQLLSLETDIQVAGQFSSAKEARENLPGCRTDVCIIDISMPDESGLSLLKDIPSGLACIMLSVHDSAAMVENALNAGAKGYLSKRCSPDELILAVRTVYAGGCYLTPEIAQKLTSANQTNRSINSLTKREREVGELLAKGMEVKAIATQLGLSHKTIHVHRANAMDKLGVTNNVALARCFTTEII